MSAVSDLVQIEPSTEALRVLAGSTSPCTDAKDIIRKLYYSLEGIAIEVPDHERVDSLVQGTGPSKLEQMFLFVRYFVYLSSNNLLDDKRTDKLVEWMVDSKTQWVLDHLLDLRTPTTEIFGCNILVSAARLGRVDLIRSLIAKGVDVDASTGHFFRRTALEEAVRYERPPVVKLLLNAGARLNSQVEPDHSLLYTVLGRPHALEMSKMLLNMCVDPGTALRLAVVWNHVEAVQLLIDAGADIDAPVGDKYDLGSIGNIYEPLRTPIQVASLAGNTEIIQVLINGGADVNTFKWEGYDNDSSWEAYRRHQWESYGNFKYDMAPEDILMTPLQAAVFRRDPALVQILLDAGAHVDETAYGDTPLQMAAALEEAKIMQILRRHGANVNAPAADNYGMTALQAAARAGNYELVQNMLVSGSDINAAASPCGGRTALQAAAESGNVDLARILIKAGACVNAGASPINGRTCLQAAVDHRHVEMVLMLLNAGADANGSAATISGGLTALQAALRPFGYYDQEPDIEEDSREQVVEYDEESETDDDSGEPAVEHDEEELDSDENYEAPDIWKAKKSWNTILQALLDAGAQLSDLSSPYESMTGIMGAVSSKRTDLVRCCPLREADPHNAAGGMTALGAAPVKVSDEVVASPMKGGVDVHAQCGICYPASVPDEPTQWTALHVAAKTGRIELANLLLQEGAEINMPALRRGSSTVLQAAIASENVTMVQFLLNKGADPNAYGERETFRTCFTGPVHMEILNSLAVAGGDFDRIVQVYELAFSKEVMQKALDSGALIHWTAEQKGHLLQAGIREGYCNLIQEMLDTGADVNTPAAYDRGRTALQKAAEEGFTHIVTLLLYYGADVNAPAGYFRGITALQGAALNGNLQITLMLLKAGADINAAPAVQGGRTALEAAAEHGRLDIVSLLLEKDHDIEGMELRCNSAAFYAEEEGHNVIARILREHKAGQGTTE